RAAVSSFGFGGTNFHTVLEAYEDQALSQCQDAPRRRRPAELFLFTAKSPAELATEIQKFAAELHGALKAGAELELADLAFTLHRRPRPALAHRLAIVATNLVSLQDQLAAAVTTVQTGQAPPASAGITYQDGRLGCGTPLAFLFPGQGAQFPDMLR